MKRRPSYHRGVRNRTLFLSFGQSQSFDLRSSNEEGLHYQWDGVLGSLVPKLLVLSVYIPWPSGLVMGSICTENAIVARLQALNL